MIEIDLHYSVGVLVLEHLIHDPMLGSRINVV